MHKTLVFKNLALHKYPNQLVNKAALVVERKLSKPIIQKPAIEHDPKPVPPASHFSTSFPKINLGVIIPSPLSSNIEKDYQPKFFKHLFSHSPSYISRPSEPPKQEWEEEEETEIIRVRRLRSSD